MNWDLHACSDLSGCWLKTDTLLGDLVVESEGFQKIHLRWWPLNLRTANNVTLGTYKTPEDAMQAAENWWADWRKKMRKAKP